MQPMQQPYQAPHLMQASAYSSAYVDDSASFGARGVPLEVSGVLQFSNGSLGPHVAGVGNWQHAPPQHMSYTPPSFSTSNPPPFMRQGVASSQPSLANSSARQSQRLELPPLPRPLSSAAALAPAQPDVAEQFKPSVYAHRLSHVLMLIRILITLCMTLTTSSAASTPATESCASHLLLLERLPLDRWTTAGRPSLPRCRPQTARLSVLFSLTSAQGSSWQHFHFDSKRNSRRLRAILFVRGASSIAPRP